MRRFDLRLPRGGTDASYLLDVQADLLSHLDTRVVVPLVPLAKRRTILRELNPVFLLPDGEHVMITTQIGSVRRSELGRVVANLADEHFAITRTLDVLLTGF